MYFVLKHVCCVDFKMETDTETETITRKPEQRPGVAKIYLVSQKKFGVLGVL